jgi:hypothetical protein
VNLLHSCPLLLPATRALTPDMAHSYAKAISAGSDGLLANQLRSLSYDEFAQMYTTNSTAIFTPLLNRRDHATLHALAVLGAFTNGPAEQTQPTDKAKNGKCAYVPALLDFQFCSSHTTAIITLIGAWYTPPLLSVPFQSSSYSVLCVAGMMAQKITCITLR